MAFFSDSRKKNMGKIAALFSAACLAVPLLGGLQDLGIVGGSLRDESYFHLDRQCLSEEWNRTSSVSFNRLNEPHFGPHAENSKFLIEQNRIIDSHVSMKEGLAAYVGAGIAGVAGITLASSRDDDKKRAQTPVRSNSSSIVDSFVDAGRVIFAPVAFSAGAVQENFFPSKTPEIPKVKLG